MDAASGGDSPLVGRKRHVDPMGESLSRDFVRMRPLQSDSTHQPARVTNYEDGVAGDYINPYEDALIEDIYLLGEKEVAAES